MNKIKWQLIETVDCVKTYEFKIDRKNSFLIDEIIGESCDVYFNASKIAEYSSLRSAKRGVETIIKNIAKVWNEYNEE